MRKCELDYRVLVDLPRTCCEEISRYTLMPTLLY